MSSCSFVFPAFCAHPTVTSPAGWHAGHPLIPVAAATIDLHSLAHKAEIMRYILKKRGVKIRAHAQHSMARAGFHNGDELTGKINN